MISFHCFISLKSLQDGIRARTSSLVHLHCLSQWLSSSATCLPSSATVCVSSVAVVAGVSTSAKSGLGAPRGVFTTHCLPGVGIVPRHCRLSRWSLLGLFLLLFLCFGGHSLNLGFLLKSWGFFLEWLLRVECHPLYQLLLLLPLQNWTGKITPLGQLRWSCGFLVKAIMIILKKMSLLFQRKRNLSGRNWICSCVMFYGNRLSKGS